MELITQSYRETKLASAQQDRSSMNSGHRIASLARAKTNCVATLLSHPNPLPSLLQFFLSPGIRQRSDQRPETHSVLFRTVTRLHGMADVTPSALGLRYLLYCSLLFDQTGHIFEFSSSKLRRKHSPATEKRMLELKQELVTVNPFPTVISRCQQVLRKRERFCH